MLDLIFKQLNKNDLPVFCGKIAGTAIIYEFFPEPSRPKAFGNISKTA